VKPAARSQNPSPETRNLKVVGEGSGFRVGAERLDRKVDVRLLGKGNSNFDGARPVHPITTMITWTRTCRLSIQNALSERLEEWEQNEVPSFEGRNSKPETLNLKP